MLSLAIYSLNCAARKFFPGQTFILTGSAVVFWLNRSINSHFISSIILFKHAVTVHNSPKPINFHFILSIILFNHAVTVLNSPKPMCEGKVCGSPDDLYLSLSSLCFEEQGVRGD